MVSDLYTIKVYDTSKTFSEVMDEHELGLSMAIVDKICYAIDNDLARVNIARIDTGGVNITLHASERNYIDTIETNLKTLIKYEEYEMCARAKKAMEKFNEK